MVNYWITTKYTNENTTHIFVSNNSSFYNLSILHNQSIQNESHFQPHKIHRRYGVLRRADVHHLPRDCLFLIWKDLRGSRQRFHRWKRCLGRSLADGRDGDGEGGVSG